MPNKTISISEDIYEFIKQNQDINVSGEFDLFLRTKYLGEEFLTAELQRLEAKRIYLEELKRKIVNANAISLLSKDERRFLQLEISVKGRSIRTEQQQLWQRFKARFPETRIPEPMFEYVLVDLLAEMGL